MKNSEQPAFAVSKEMCEHSEITEYPFGLTKREYFAAMALSGIMANPSCTPTRQEHFDNIGVDAMNAADATLRFLNEP